METHDPSPLPTVASTADLLARCEQLRRQFRLQRFEMAVMRAELALTAPDPSIRVRELNSALSLLNDCADALKEDAFQSWWEIAVETAQRQFHSHLHALQSSWTDFDDITPALEQLERRIAHWAPDGDARFEPTRTGVAGDAHGPSASNQLSGLRAREVDQLRVLIREMQHRSRNLLALINSLAEAGLRHAASMEEFRASFSERLLALARVQKLISPDVDTRANLERVIRDELSAHGIDTTCDARVIIHGPREIRIRPAVLQVVALVLHELITNAVKHGNLLAEGSRVDIQWQVIFSPEQPRRRLRITWDEIGDRSNTEGSTLGGYGRELIEQALPYQFGAETSYQADSHGITCCLTIPLT